MNDNSIKISPDAIVGHALDIFDRFQIKSIPVIYKEEIIRIIARQDIYNKNTNRQENIFDIMSKNPLTIPPDDDLIKAIEIIKKTNIFEIIVAKYNKIVGILSIDDIIKKVYVKKQ